jgi:UDP-N-acetylglucosamine 2-epimerase
MYKVVTIVGTRPEIIKLSSVIKLLDEFTDHTLIHTGQHYDYSLNEVFFKDLGLREPDVYLNAVYDKEKDSGVTIAANCIREFEAYLKEFHGGQHPNIDCILVYGDTNSSLCAYAAKRRKIPIFHMEAGNRCFDAIVPEEINRKIIDHLADVNMVISEHARSNLIREGLPSEFIFKVGSSMPQVLASLENKRSEILSELNLKSKDYIVLSIHREENIGFHNFTVLVDLIVDLAKERSVVLSAHPRTKDFLSSFDRELKSVIDNGRLIISAPFGFIDYIELQKNAYCTISDSGTIMEESSLLNFPAVTIRKSYERPEGMDEGVLVVSDWHKEAILQAVRVCVSTHNSRKIVKDYQGDDVAQKVVKIILSMISKVNSKVYYHQSSTIL